MDVLQNMPRSGVIVISVIAVLFVLAVVMLFYTRVRYRFLESRASGSSQSTRGFRAAILTEYTEAYKQYGQNVNTPAIISDVIGDRLSGLLFCERFLNNAVSLFVTLGLFGTFLGLSMSVTSLTELIGLSNTSEWLSVLDSVGGGLMSALSGMGVAFYTSLVGAGCAIILTLLRTIFNPQSQREKLATQMELWLDHTVAPTLPTRANKDDVSLIHELADSMKTASKSMERTLNDTSAAMQKTLEGSRPYLLAFHQTVEKFNKGVRDFSEIDYNLRGTIERLDVSARDLVNSVRQAGRNVEKGERK